MNLKRANTSITEYLAKVQKHLRKVQSLYITEFRVCSARVQILINMFLLKLNLLVYIPLERVVAKGAVGVDNLLSSSSLS